jgi:hypothetical protein
MFGDPVPGNADELEEAITERMENPDDLRAMIEESGETEGDYKGWIAEIDDGEGNMISTKGYPSKDALKADLRAVGVQDIDEY